MHQRFFIVNPLKNILSGICASTLALTFGLATLAPVTAAPVFMPRASESSVNIQNVQFGPDWRRGGNRAESRNERRQDRFEQRGNRAYYNGHRGYRQYNGVWFPAAAFIAGAIIGGAMDNQPRASGNAHVQYCYDRYRSYRASDNSFQPYNGPRRQCISS